MLELANHIIAQCKKSQNKVLDLGNCDIKSLTALPELFTCTHITTLILSGEWWERGQSENQKRSTNSGGINQIRTIPKKISKLINLKEFIVGGSRENGLASIEFLQYLPNLTSLYLSRNKITDISPLRFSKNLESLDLWQNPVEDFSILNELEKLRFLSIGNLGSVSTETFKNLYHLESLELVNVEFVDSDFLYKMSKLTYLFVAGGNSREGDFIKGMKDLETLIIQDFKLSDWNLLSQLTKLRTLKLNKNDIPSLEFLENLPLLSKLEVNNNPIPNIEPLKYVPELTHLVLTNIQTSDWEPIGHLSLLNELDLSRNNIVNLGFVKHLISLTRLDVSSNKISNIDSLEGLKNLKALSLTTNDLSKLPRFIFDLMLPISWDEFGLEGDALYLAENALEYPPIEILKQGYQSIFDWFDAVKKRLNEIKIVLIGDPKAGKTSLLKRLKYDTFDHNEVQTDGINIEQINFGECDSFKDKSQLSDLTGHFWDFGGQEIMNATHQFFLTNRSLYILILDARKDANIAVQIRQWVKRIKATGGDSPIIIVANQIDVNPGFGFSNEFELQQEFPQIKSFIKTSCDTAEGFEILKEKLEELIPQAELFNTEIDEKWILIKEELQKATQDKHFLDEATFIEICNKHQLVDKFGRKNAINFLHDLGLVLHFENLNLAEYYVLDPYWITYGVYQIVTSSFAGRMKGVVEMDQLEYIVNEEEDKKEVYKPANFRKINYDNPNQRRFLVDILNEFKLCFYKRNNTAFIIPDLLDTKEPLEVTEPIRKAVNAIRFVYEYEYLPNSIIPFIMVEANNLIKNMWRTGCVLSYLNSNALISRYQNRISITVIGEHKQKREFMAIIRHLIDSINQKISDKPRLLIPLPGINAYADYDVLLRREARGRSIYIHDEDKPSEQEFDLSELLEGIPTQDEVKAIRTLLNQSAQILTTINQVEVSQTLILSKIERYEELLNERLNESDIVAKVRDVVKEVNDAQKTEISKDVMLMLSTGFELFGNDLDDKLKSLYEELKKTDDVNMKLSLSIPFIKLLGIDFGVEFDVKSWATKMYNKYELNIFKAMGMLN